MKERIDITGKIYQAPVSRTNEANWPMYSYERPASMVWNEIANAMHEQGWSEAQIKDWLQSKSARWALDGSLGEALADTARKWALQEFEVRS